MIYKDNDKIKSIENNISKYINLYDKDGSTNNKGVSQVVISKKVHQNSINTSKTNKSYFSIIKGVF